MYFCIPLARTPSISGSTSLTVTNTELFLGTNQQQRKNVHQVHLNVATVIRKSNVTYCSAALDTSWLSIKTLLCQDYQDKGTWHMAKYGVSVYIHVIV